jgi:hypothetical protein
MVSQSSSSWIQEALTSYHHGGVVHSTHAAEAIPECCSVRVRVEDLEALDAE